MGSIVADLAEKLSSTTGSMVVDGSLKLKEQAEAEALTAGQGQLWVNTAVPNELYFTTDADDDIAITSGTSLAFNADAAQTWNDSGAAVDFRIESDDNANMFFFFGFSLFLYRCW